ncbi:MAG: MerR family transcriptional regulator, partial [Actinomycetes bacterium]
VVHLRSRGITELESMTLMSDGASIYECASADDIIDLLQGGQGVFGIAISKVWTEVEGSLATLQGESATDGSLVANLTMDELSERRKRKGA